MDEDETVFIVARRCRPKDVYHSYPGCPRLSTAKGVTDKKLSVLHDDVRPCPDCHDGPEKERGEPDFSYYEAARQADPEDW